MKRMKQQFQTPRDDIVAIDNLHSINIVVDEFVLKRVSLLLLLGQYCGRWRLVPTVGTKASFSTTIGSHGDHVVHDIHIEKGREKKVERLNAIFEGMPWDLIFRIIYQCYAGGQSIKDVL